MYCPCLQPPAPRSKCAGQLKGGQLEVPRASNMAHFRGSIVGTMKDGSCSRMRHIVAERSNENFIESITLDLCTYGSAVCFYFVSQSGGSVKLTSSASKTGGILCDTWHLNFAE